MRSTTRRSFLSASPLADCPSGRYNWTCPPSRTCSTSGRAPLPRELSERIDEKRIRCLACGHRCPIPEGAVGVCKVRGVRNGQLYGPWGYVGGVQCDPIEKKPFFHAVPGALAFSFGMLGCDLHCSYCQNWVTSQALRDPEAVALPRAATPESLVRAALDEGARVMVSTYNEPLITAEWAVAIFKAAREAGLMTGFVSNGNGTPQVLDYLRPHIDLYKVDLKSFNDRRYRELGGRLEPILETIRHLHASGVWVEIVTLLIPGFNDGDDEITRLTEFIASVSPDIPWHVTAFHADYHMTAPGNTTPGDADEGRGDRRTRRAALHLRREPPGPRRHARRHALRFLQPGAHLAIRIPDQDATTSPRTAAAPTARLPSRADGTARSRRNGRPGRFCRSFARDRALRPRSSAAAEALPRHEAGRGPLQHAPARRSRAPGAAAARAINNYPCPSSTALRGRSAAFASPSRIAATCAASTACRRRSTSGCRGRTSCSSRRSCASRGVFTTLGVRRVRHHRRRAAAPP